VFRWFVYNLSPSFNWSAHGFSGRHPLLKTEELVTDQMQLRNWLEEFLLGTRQGRVNALLDLARSVLELIELYIVSSFSLFRWLDYTAMLPLLVSCRWPYLRSILTLWHLAELAARYKEDGMLAYVELVQRKEKEIGCDVLTHQKWSGANYIDKILQSISSGSSSTSAVGKDSTENTFWFYV
jgi:isocitrate lyase